MFTTQLGQEPEYYGPPRPGQSFAQYESFMSLPLAAGGAVVGALLLGPIGLLAGGIGGWLAPRLATKSKSKSETQGG